MTTTTRTRTRKRWPWAIAGALGGLALVAAVAVQAAIPAYAFPPPSGPFGIGTLTYHWVDQDRVDLLSADPGAHRELMAQIWYPAAADPAAPRALYVADAGAVETAMAGLHGYPRLALAGLGAATADAVAAAPPTADRPRFPVLVFLEGLTGYRQMNTFQVQELVSHGYAVVALDQPGIAADVVYPDGRHSGTAPPAEVQALLRPNFGEPEPVPTLHGRPFPDGMVPFLAQDVGFALDRLAEVDRADPHALLTGRLDLDRTGVFGVSMGGIVAAESCRVDPRLRACLMLDSRMPADVVDDGLAQPAMWLTRDAGSMQREGWKPADVEQHQQTMQGAFESARGVGYLVRIPGTFHVNFTDIPDLVPVPALFGLAGPIDIGHAHDLMNAYTLAFFDRHLLGAPAPLLDEPAGEHPDVQVDVRGGPA